MFKTKFLLKRGVAQNVAMVAVLLSGCTQSESPDVYSGTWQNMGLPNVTLEVKHIKGGDAFSVKEVNQNSNRNFPELVGKLNGEALIVTAPFGGEIPITVKDDVLTFNAGRGCKDCNTYKRLK